MIKNQHFLPNFLLRTIFSGRPYKKYEILTMSKKGGEGQHSTVAKLLSKENSIDMCLEGGGGLELLVQNIFFFKFVLKVPKQNIGFKMVQILQTIETTGSSTNQSTIIFFNFLVE